jgi:lysophospholipase L1-like esterase
MARESVMKRQILFFGASHVAGIGDPAGLGWVGRVAAASFRAGRPFIPYNLGVGGETSVDVLARWQIEAQPRLRAMVESRVVFSFGVNDTTLQGAGTRVEPTNSQEALSVILRRARAMELPALVVGPAPVANEEQNERIESISRRFFGVCREKGVGFVEVFEALHNSKIWREEVAAEDGAHPGAAGYKALTKVVLATEWNNWLPRS